MFNPNENMDSPEGFHALPLTIPEHRLLRRIGRGSYGEVWLALNAMKKWAAVKVVHRFAEDDSRAYEQEFRGLRRYDDLSGTDDSLMPIKNVGENREAGYFYYAMELADDANTCAPLPRPQADEDASRSLERRAEIYRPRTLSEELRRRGRLTAQECVDCGLALAESLVALHRGGLIHRDIKPSNIIFVNGRPKLADVGLVTAADATLNSFAGTSGFVPLHGAGQPTGDIFALGKVLYMAATGRSVTDFPQAAENLEEMPDEERKRMAELEAVYERACEPSPVDRQPSAQALKDDLEMLRRNESVIRLRQLEEERQNYEIQRQELRQRRKRLAVLSLIGTTAAIMVVAALLIYTWRLRTAHEATLAELQANKLSRMVARKSGWSQRDWELIRASAKVKLDDAVISQAISALSGLDARVVSEWPKIEASSAAFARDGRVLLAGFGASRAMLISDGTNRMELPVIGEGQACWSAEGDPLILQIGTNSCVLREARSGNVRREFSLSPHEEVFLSNTPAIAVSEDGTLVAAMLIQSNESRVVVWDARNGDVLGQANQTAYALGFAPDGSLLAAGDAAGNASVWNIRPFTLLAQLPPARRPSPINCLAFGEDRVVPRAGPGESKRWLLALGDAGAGIVVWDLTKKLPRSFCLGSDYNCQSLSFSPDGLTLAAGGRNDVGIWDIMAGLKILRIGDVSSSDNLALAFDSTGKRLVAGSTAASAPSQVTLVELDQDRGVQRLRGLNFNVRKVWFSPNGKLVAALSDDWSLAVWDATSGRLDHLFQVNGFYADNAGGAFDEAGDKIGFAAGTQAWLFDVASGQKLEAWQLPKGYDDELQFDHQGSLLLVRRQRVSEHSNTWEWILQKLPRGRVPVVLQMQQDSSYRPISMAFPVPASRFVVFSQDRATRLNSVRAFDVQTGSQLWKFEQHDSRPWGVVRISAGGKWCGVNVGDRNEMQIVRMSDGSPVYSVLGTCLAIGPDGSDYVVSGATDDQWVLRSREKSKIAIPFGFDGTIVGDTFAFSPDGKYVSWGATDGSVLLADISAVRRRLAGLQH